MHVTIMIKHYYCYYYYSEPLQKLLPMHNIMTRFFKISILIEVIYFDQKHPLNDPMIAMVLSSKANLFGKVWLFRN